MRRTKPLGWLAVAFVLAALTIPWFLWGNDAVVAGLPIWLWWHVAWMLLAAAVFRLFADRAWGIGIEADVGAGSDSTSGADGSGGDRR